MSRYLFIETLISMAINAAISASFAFLVFAGRPEIELWGMRGLALDFMPQSFMIAMMSVLVPSALTRKRIKAGAVPPRKAPPSWLPRNLLARAMLIALGATAVLGGAVIAVLAASGFGPLTFGVVLPMKVAYGAIVAMIVTPPAVCAALREAAPDCPGVG